MGNQGFSMRWMSCWIGCLLICGTSLCAAGERSEDGDPQTGYSLLLNQEYLTPDFDAVTFSSLRNVWPEYVRQETAGFDAAELRQFAFDRYGLTGRPNETTNKPLQYVVDGDGNWTMNCFSCHGGSVDGEVIPGAPNSRFDLQTLTEEVRRRKMQLGKPLSRMGLGAMFIPLGTTRGTTNAVAFGVGVMHFRDLDMNVVPGAGVPQAVHHDMDAPPWWHYHKKSHIYIDGFAETSHRALMQFMLVRENSAQQVFAWEDDFRHIEAYLMSLRAPRYPGPIDAALATEGRTVFEANCSECHGTYGEDWTYPERRIELAEIGTDPVRLTALTVSGRQKYADSWLAHYGSEETIVDPGGYVAPPLDGVWASAPYFHNGSVPTLWHVLHPDERPEVWRRVSDSLDHARMGLMVEEVAEIPLTVSDPSARRSFFDTRRFGKSRRGHDYPAALSAAEKRAVLEYLKTL